MSSLLVQSCSKSKIETDRRVPALELYSGYFFKIIKKSIREGEFDENIEISILSAEHGLIESQADIEWYDRPIDAERAAELAPDLRAAFRERADQYDEIVVNAGSLYRRALTPIPDIESDVYRIEGGGIGEKGSVLKQFVRGQVEPESATGIVRFSA